MEFGNEYFASLHGVRVNAMKDIVSDLCSELDLISFEKLCSGAPHGVRSKNRLVKAVLSMGLREAVEREVLSLVFWELTKFTDHTWVDPLVPPKLHEDCEFWCFLEDLGVSSSERLRLMRGLERCFQRLSQTLATESDATLRRLGPDWDDESVGVTMNVRSGKKAGASVKWWVDFTCNGLTFAMLHERWIRLRTRYSGRPSRERSRVFNMLASYEAISGFGPAQGHQGAVVPEVMERLTERLDVQHECFASPLNVFQPSFCSLFGTTDRFYGSKGSFWNFMPTQGSFQANPPFVPELMEKAIQRIELILSQKGNGPLVFVVFMPRWRGERAYSRAVFSEWITAGWILFKNTHTYLKGGQHKQGSDDAWLSTADTAVLVFQNAAGAAKFPISAALLRDIVRPCLTDVEKAGKAIHFPEERKQCTFKLGKGVKRHLSVKQSLEKNREERRLSSPPSAPAPEPRPPRPLPLPPRAWPAPPPFAMPHVGPGPGWAPGPRPAGYPPARGPPMPMPRRRGPPPPPPPLGVHHPPPLAWPPPPRDQQRPPADRQADRDKQRTSPKEPGEVSPTELDSPKSATLDNPLANGGAPPRLRVHPPMPRMLAPPPMLHPSMYGHHPMWGPRRPWPGPPPRLAPPPRGVAAPPRALARPPLRSPRPPARSPRARSPHWNGPPSPPSPFLCPRESSPRVEHAPLRKRSRSGNPNHDDEAHGSPRANAAPAKHRRVNE